MQMTDKHFAGSIPAIYQKLMVPMIFEPYARETAERIGAVDPGDVLEIATGTGVLTRAMATVLGPQARIVATDLNQPMLDLAMAEQGYDSRISWQQADGQDLPFAGEAFDIVACQFGVMFFPDKARGYREAHRVLRPGGRYVFSVWDKLDNNDFVTVIDEALAARFPADPPRFMDRTPHGYWNLEIIGDDVKAAGFEAVTIETVDQLSLSSSPMDAATAYCQGTPLRGEIEARAPGALASVTHMAAEALEERFGTGPIRGKIRAFIITAVK